MANIRSDARRRSSPHGRKRRERAPAHPLGGLVEATPPPHPRPLARRQRRLSPLDEPAKPTGLRADRCRVRERRRRGGLCSAWLRAMPEVGLSSAERVLFPEDGITKADLFAYYGRVAGVIVPHLANRP